MAHTKNIFLAAGRKDDFFLNGKDNCEEKQYVEALRRYTRPSTRKVTSQTDTRNVHRRADTCVS